VSEPFGVYIHWPFCLSKCPYCDFNSHVRAAAIDQPRYAAAFEAEIARTAARIGARTVSTIFIGGGTPSLMQPATVAAVLDAIARHWTVAANAEITLEANRPALRHGFHGFRAVGVNRFARRTGARRHRARRADDAIPLPKARRRPRRTSAFERSRLI
jgi:oxygen-independent coproporphyrinogen-3 oxidase